MTPLEKLQAILIALPTKNVEIVRHVDGTYCARIHGNGATSPHCKSVSEAIEALHEHFVELGHKAHTEARSHLGHLGIEVCK